MDQLKYDSYIVDSVHVCINVLIFLSQLFTVVDEDTNELEESQIIDGFNITCISWHEDIGTGNDLLFAG